MSNRFDPELPGLIKGEVTRVAVIDPGYFGNPPGNLVLNPDQDFTIEMDWNLDDPLAPLWLAALAGNWVVTAYAESVGPGPDLLVATVNVPTASAVSAGVKRSFTATLTVPAGTLPEENPGDPTRSGVYDIVLTTFLNSNLGTAGYDIMGFADGPRVKVENPD